MNFVFNDFKRRFLNGEVPSADTWTFIPVSDTFKTDFEFEDFRLDQYRTIYDFKDVSDKRYYGSAFNFTIHNDTTASDGVGKLKYVNVTGDTFSVRGRSFLEGKQLTHIWSKVIDDESFKKKPMYVTNENFEHFKSFYEHTISGNAYIQDYLISGGFYFIRSKEELQWFAERSNSNSTIIGVIGDNIDGTIDTPIGVNDKNPFNGILDGNFFAFDVNLHAKYTDNGVVGVLGPYGVVRNFKLVHNDPARLSIECEIPITLKYLKKDGRDINCGLLVGRNYGLIENIDASDLKTFNLYGFVPSVYSVTNKSDNYKWNENVNIVRKKFDEKNDNYFFSNSFCINSPGNICPYVGYFAEGKFADDATTVCLDTFAQYFSHHDYLSDRTNYFINLHNTGLTVDITGNSNGFEYNPLGYYLYDDKKTQNLTFISTSAIENVVCYINSPLYYGLDISGRWTTRNIGPRKDDTAAGSALVNLPKSVICYNSNLVKATYGSNITAINEPSYEMTRCSMRMHPQARAAYNVGVIVGANFGSAQNINVSAIIKNTSNFVGFIGGLAGKQGEGYVFSANVSVDNQFEYEFNTPELGGVVYYKQTPILPSAVLGLVDIIQDETTRNGIDEQYFSTWYDNGMVDEDNPVNTAQNVTNDVIAYKLKPIFVAGGLFGRYVPTYNIDRTKYIGTLPYTGCIVDCVKVVYNDNYLTTTALKNLENAYGVMIGKVDYETQTNSIAYDTSLRCTNSLFSAVNNAGEPFKTYLSTLGTNGYEPVQVKLDDTTSAVAEDYVNNKFVGIFELKYNVLDSVVYNAYNDDSNTGSTPHKLSQYSIFDICDYPIDLKSHEGGILQTHILTQYMNNYITAAGYNGEPYNTMEMSASDGKVYPQYDHWHQYFMSPVVNMATLPANNDFSSAPGYNKRNMAIKLITMDNCFSNVRNYIQLYDDYVNQWNLNKLPYINSSGNCFSSQKDFYAIGKWWSYYKTNSDSTCTNDFAGISGLIGWNSNSANFDDYKMLFAQGFDNLNINGYLQNGIQNTFDGYTTVEHNANSQLQCWYSDNVSGISDCFLNLNDEDCQTGPAGINDNVKFKHYEVNCLEYITDPDNEEEQKLTYNTHRLFKKNILSVIDPNLTTTVINTLDFNNATNNWQTRTTADDYFYYTYDNIEHTENDINRVHVPLTSAFAIKQDVYYDVLTDTLTQRMGYVTNIDTEDDNKLEIGEYYTPTEIRSKLDNYVGEGNPTFTTTSVSSKNNFAGLLVVDSSGRNVMFYDNENSTQLTGNSIYFPCYINNTEKVKLLLEIR